MKRIIKVYEKLKELSQGEKGIETKQIAKSLNLNRANVSSDLNKLIKKGKAKKINKSRPVLYISIDDKENSLDKLGKKSKALSMAIEQAKAVIFYPEQGIHTLILGETGVGKTTFANLMYKFAIETKKLSSDAPFITFNCADYANNPQFLLGQLFGVKKGSYTGAMNDSEGLIEKANGGILFLDEVHRLPPEGQEMFFTFMDKGLFRRLGETNKERKAKVQIISATTEDPNSSLLKTFTRRIPMVIRIPSLDERGLEERFHLINTFFKEEAYKLNSEIRISANSMKSLLSYKCINNVGQIRSDIQLLCAKAYANFLSDKKKYILIDSGNLLPHIKDGLLRTNNIKNQINRIINEGSKYFTFIPNEFDYDIKESENIDNIYEDIYLKMNELKEKDVDGEELSMELERYIKIHFTEYIESVNKKLSNINIMNVINPKVLEIVDEINKLNNNTFNRNLSKKLHFAIAMHIKALIDRINSNEKITNPNLYQVRFEHKKEFELALKSIDIIEKRYKINVPIDEAGFLTMFFVLDDVNKNEENVGILVIAHGNSVASSIVEVVNFLLDCQYPIPIDLPLDVSMEKIKDKVKKYLITNKRRKGYLFLVDMGSLLSLGDTLQEELNIPIKTVPYVSTIHVIESTRKAIMGQNLDDIYKSIIAINTPIDCKKKVIESSRTEEKNNLVIISACQTGEGSAIIIKDYLQKKLQLRDKNVIFITMEISNRKEFNQQISEIEKEKEIICILSSFLIDSDIPTFNIEDMLHEGTINRIQRIIDNYETYRTIGQKLEEHLEYVNGQEVLKDVRNIIVKVENKLKIQLDHGELIGILMHTSCMINRLKSKQVLVEYEGKERKKIDNYPIYIVIRRNFEFIEKKYNIKIPDDEVCYIIDFFNKN